MLDGQTHYGRPAAHAPLSSSDLQRILDATYTLLRDTGVGFDPVEEAMDLLSAAGCDIDEAGYKVSSTSFLIELVFLPLHSHSDGVDAAHTYQSSKVFQ